MLGRLRFLLPVIAILSCTPLLATTDGLKRVLVIDSFGRDFAPYSLLAFTFRTELAQHSANPIEFLEVSLETVQSETPEETAVLEYVRVLCMRRKFDLVVTNGQPAARFWLRYRHLLLPDTPSLFTALDVRHLSHLPLSPDDAVVPARIDTPGQMGNILQVLPETTHVVIILGDSSIERFWASELRRDWNPFEGRVHITLLNDLPFEEVLRRTASLPPRSVIFFALMLVDAAGVPHDQTIAFERLRANSNVPIFGWSDNLLGHGIIGGPLVSLEEVGREAARTAKRILSGEPPGTVRMPGTESARVAYDWRELRRWDIDSDRLPPGSEILFRPPSIYREYGWLILASLVIIGAQTLAIAGLLVHRHRRRQALAEALRLRGELAHAGRVSVMGQLASSLAHELNQPLGAILRNAEAADLFLDASPPNLDEVRAILSDIRKDDQRAGGVVDGIRGFLRRHETKMTLVSVGAVVEAVAALLGHDAQSRGVTLVTDLARDLPPVRGNQVQLQQVLLNLMINGMEAMAESADGRKVLTVRARPLDDGAVEIAVRDSGPGIPAEDLPRIFESFYTTKPGGMGMGLAICRRIVEAHGGRIQAENHDGGGATLRVTLPVGGSDR